MIFFKYCQMLDIFLGISKIVLTTKISIYEIRVRHIDNFLLLQLISQCETLIKHN